LPQAEAAEPPLRVAPQQETAPDPAAAAAPEPAPRTDASSAEASPAMAQWLEIKAANPDSLLWYRMGDFYELFFDDAVKASAALSIVLTKRGKHLGEDIPMCGVPIHRADEYLQRLIRQGHRVAVAEQLEDPAEAKKRGSKSVVRRDVVRLVTPGTLTEDTLLDARARNYLTAVFRAPSGASALASVDISTGEFEVGEVGAEDLAGELVRLAPGEVVVADAHFADENLKRAFALAGAAVTPVPRAYFDPSAGKASLKEHLKVAELGGFGDFTPGELSAIGALLKYVDLTQIGKRPVLLAPKRSGAGATLIIDAASRASLELTRSASGDKQSSLLYAIDRTVTGPGARELAARLASPLCDPALIGRRLDAVGFLIGEDDLRGQLRAALRSCPDIARARSRLAFGRGSPRDLAAIRDGLRVASACAAHLAQGHLSKPGDGRGLATGLPEELSRIAGELRSVNVTLCSSLAAALIDDPPLLRREGGFVREGYREELDEARRLKEDSRSVMAGLELRYVEATGIKSLKVRHNNILGFYVEVTQGNARPLLEGEHAKVFRHRQTMASAMRFTTDDLIEIEGRIASATERAQAIEDEVFAELASAVEAEQRLSAVAAALAETDVTAGLAELARNEGYTRPRIDKSRVFQIRGGRHPVVEQALRQAKAGPFIENDCALGSAGSTGAGSRQTDDEPEAEAAAEAAAEGRIWLLTGPNMAGKSTFLRQNALIAVLAQMGSFVPARSAVIGVVDRLFSRVGASDDLARGRSTFMVEMVETAAILNQATERSLIILDEIGRGTATFDGLSIAWATVEFLHEAVKARVLFATHYHELTVLARRLDGVANVTMDVREWQDEIVFLHKVRPGAADRSYGIQVAKLAGLPGSVVERAREVLAILEKSGNKKSARSEALDELPLFAAPKAPERAEPAKPSPVEAALAAIAPDNLTPRAALDEIYRLKALLAELEKPGR
jgi:DNA mismatch repair protein MutS